MCGNVRMKFFLMGQNLPTDHIRVSDRRIRYMNHLTYSRPWSTIRSKLELSKNITDENGVMPKNKC